MTDAPKETLPPTPTPNTCSTCANYVSHSDTSGTCHFHPPTGNGGWPSVQATDWCADYASGGPHA